MAGTLTHTFLSFQIVLCALAACASAKPGALSYALGLSSPLGVHLYPSPSLGYSSFSSFPYSSYPFSYSTPSFSYSSPIAYSSPAISYSSPAISYSSPAITYSAPSAPIAYAAPTPVAAVPATLATKTQYHAQVNIIWVTISTSSARKKKTELR